MFAQVSVGETGFCATTRWQGHPLFGTRYYDPSVGRWTQQEPLPGSIADPRSLNAYSYVYDNPVNYVDPTGYYCVFGTYGGPARPLTQ